MRLSKLMMIAMTAGTVAACNGCGGRSEEDSVKNTLRDYVHAYADGDGMTMCSLMSPAAQRNAIFAAATFGAEPPCSEAVLAGRDRLTAPQIAALRHVSVTDVKIDGAVATARTSLGSGLAELRKVHGGWLVNSID